MPYDVSGNFSRVYDFETDRVNGIPIMSARVDGEFDGISTALSLAYLRDGRAALTGDLRLSSYKILGIGDGAVGSPGLQYANETNTGWYRIGAGQQGLSITGTKRLEVNTTGVIVTGDLTVSGVFNLTDEAYGVTWDTKLDPPTKNAVYDKIQLLAPLASPTFTGVPAGPTAAVDTNTTQLATTGYVVGQGYAKLASPALTGVPTAPTAAVDTNTTQLATTGYVIGQGYSKLASPTFTGIPLAPTAIVDTNTTQLATTAYVIGQGYAKLASPTLTGIPAAPTAGAGTNTTQLATCAFVQNALSISVQTVANGVTITPVATNDLVEVTAQNAGFTLANWSGSPVNGWGMVARFKDNGTARAIAYGTKYRAVGITLPTTTVVSKWLYLVMIYNSTDDKYDVTGTFQE